MIYHYHLSSFSGNLLFLVIPVFWYLLNPAAPATHPPLPRSDLSILHTLWIKLDEEVRSRYKEVEVALEGLLNLQVGRN